MNYASANEANNHDTDFPVMTSDDVVDMVCKPVAPASVERLEDLAPELREAAIKVYDDGGYFILSKHGVSLVRDYQRRQAASAESELSETVAKTLWSEIDALRAINARLEAENARLQDDLEAAREALKPFALDWIQYLKYPIKEDGGSFRTFMLNTLNFEAIGDSCEQAYNVMNDLNRIVK